MTEPSRPRPVVLCILDGWGHRDDREDNAIGQARTPVLDGLTASSPHALLDASELAVGLPSGQMGNSEVGHMNLGAGRVVLQDLPRIDQAIAEGQLAGIKALSDFVERIKASGGTAHLLGLLSPGGVHSHQSQMAALANHLLDGGLRVAVHGFLDGRDTPPKSALGYLKDFQAATAAPLATLSGRYYAMDRDKRWDRVQLAYQTLVDANGQSAETPSAAIEQSYGAGQSDEFLRPTVIAGFAGMQDGDGLIMANFRADRAREILSALVAPDFDGFERPRVVRFAATTGMVSYSDQLDAHLGALFPPRELDETLGQVLAAAGLTQLRIAETEKYAHVTFFFNGGREDLFPGEERILVPSPKVATYNMKPEMSAPEVTDKLVGAIDSGRFDLIVVNYANGDMVGHTGDLAAAISAAETVDTCIGRLAEAIVRADGAMLITADHGNAEQMSDATTGQAHTAHTMNRVPVILANPPEGIAALHDGRLADIAPSLLNLMGLTQPAVMTGRSLVERTAASCNAAAE